MRPRKVLELVCLLQPEEKRRFLAWLQVDLDGKQHSTWLMAKHMIAGDAVSTIWYLMYPTRQMPRDPYRDSGFRRIEFQLGQKIEEFLALEAIRKDPYLMEWQLLSELNRRNASRSFTNRHNRAIRELVESPKLDKSYYEHLYRLDREKRHHLIKTELGKDAHDNLRDLNLHLEVWWFHEKLRAALMNLPLRGKIEYQGDYLIDEIIELVGNPPFDQYPLLRIYRNLYRMLRHDLIELADEIQVWLMEAHPTLKPDVSQDIFNILNNYYVGQYNRTGNLELMQALWTLYRWAMEVGIFLQDGILPVGRYRNYLLIGLRVGARQEVFTAINQLKSLLPEAEREEEHRFSLGTYYTETGDRTMAARILSTRFTKPHYEISSRLRLLRMRYEAGNAEELEPELRSLAEYCRRHDEIKPELRQNTLNEVKLFKSLIKAQKPKQYARLLDRVERIQPLISRKWFQSQVYPNLPIPDKGKVKD